MSMKIKNFKILQIPREESKKANALANLVLAFDFISTRVYLWNSCQTRALRLPKMSINRSRSDMDGRYHCDLLDGTLSLDKIQARRIQYRSIRFCLLHGILYKRSFSGSLLRCLRPEKTDYVLREIHEGIYKNHSRARSLVRKTVYQDYF